MVAKNKKHVPAKVEKYIYQEAGSKCPFCSEIDVTTFEVHHIKSRAEEGGNEPENLILTCGNCHNKITNGVISVHEVYRAKFAVQRQFQDQELPKQKAEKSLPSNVLRFDRSSNNGIIANNVNIKTFAKSLKLQPPLGIIASDADKRSYIKHLIDRYNEFKEADRNISEFRPQVIYASIKSRFKCKWDFITIDRFPELTEFLQKKIDGTILGEKQM